MHGPRSIVSPHFAHSPFGPLCRLSTICIFSSECILYVLILLHFVCAPGLTKFRFIQILTIIIIRRYGSSVVPWFLGSVVLHSTISWIVALLYVGFISLCLLERSLTLRVTTYSAVLPAPHITLQSRLFSRVHSSVLFIILALFVACVTDCGSNVLCSTVQYCLPFWPPVLALITCAYNLGSDRSHPGFYSIRAV